MITFIHLPYFALSCCRGDPLRRAWRRRPWCRAGQRCQSTGGCTASDSWHAVYKHGVNAYVPCFRSTIQSINPSFNQPDINHLSTYAYHWITCCHARRGRAKALSAWAWTSLGWWWAVSCPRCRCSPAGSTPPRSAPRSKTHITGNPADGRLVLLSDIGHRGQMIFTICSL